MRPLTTLRHVSQALLIRALSSTSGRCGLAAGDQQEGRTFALPRPLRMFADLIRTAPPFLEMGQDESGRQQQLEIGSDSSMLLDDALGRPVRPARPFVKIGPDRPCRRSSGRRRRSASHSGAPSRPWIERGTGCNLGKSLVVVDVLRHRSTIARLAGAAGLEPATPGFGDRYSTN